MNILVNKFCKSVALLLLSLSLIPASQAYAKETEIQKAFLKEYAFLQTQKRELLSQISEFEKQSKYDKQQEEQQVTSLEKDLHYSELELDRLQDQSVLLEHRLEETVGSRELLESTIEQSLASFADLSVNTDHIKSAQDVDKKLYLVFSLADELIQKRSSVSIVKSEFYDAEGKKVFGEMLEIGAISSMAVVADKATALLPAGAGKMKVSNEAAQVSMGSISEDSSSIELFLYEDVNKSFEESADKSLLEFLNAGGIIGWVIVALGMLAIVLVILRTLFLRRSSDSIEEIRSQTVQSIASGDIEGARNICDNARGATARVVNAALRNIDRDREHLEDVVSESILHESTYLNRFGSFIIIIAAVSPLLGLLGTVTGMIATFDVITEFGTGDPKLLSGGISTALITTELGLIVAIPALIFGNLLTGWSNRIKDEVERAALSVINTYNSVEVLRPKAA